MNAQVTLGVVCGLLLIAGFNTLTQAGENTQFRTWTDSTGKHKVEAALVDFKDGKGTLRRKDGITVIVPIDKLSEADQAFVQGQSTGKQQPAPKTPTTAAQPQSDLPFELPKPPTGNWNNEYVNEKIDDAAANAITDPVSAYLSFTKALNKPFTNLLTYQQKDWLRKAADITRPKAVAVLKRDLEAAKRNADLRAAWLAAGTLSKVEKTTDVAKIVSATVQESMVSKPIWELSQAKGEVLSDSFEDSFEMGKIDVKAGEERQLLRVTATVKNVSGLSDPPYANWAIEGIDGWVHKLCSGGTDWWVEKNQGNAQDTPSIKPRRLASYDTVFLLVSGSNPIPCAYVSKGCAVLWGKEGTDTANTHLFMAEGGLAKKAIARPWPFIFGSYVGRGTEFKLDVLFVTPKDIKMPQLLLLGGKPVPVQLANMR